MEVQLKAEQYVEETEVCLQGQVHANVKPPDLELGHPVTVEQRKNNEDRKSPSHVFPRRSSRNPSKRKVSVDNLNIQEGMSEDEGPASKKMKRKASRKGSKWQTRKKVKEEETKVEERKNEIRDDEEGRRKCGPPRKYQTKEERLKAKAERRREQRRKMTPEQRQQFLQRQRENKRRKRANMTKEEKEQYLRKNRERIMERRKQLREEGKAKKELSEEEIRLQKAKNYFYLQSKMAMMTREEREAYKKEKAEYAKKWRNSLTGEKLAKYLEYKRIRAIQSQRTTGVGSGSEYCRQRKAKETPEERQRTLRGYKISQAVRKLMKQLRESGANEDKMEQEVVKLKEKMWAEPYPPLEAVSSYQPRPWKSSAASQEAMEVKPRQRPYKPRPRRQMHKPGIDNGIISNVGNETRSEAVRMEQGQAEMSHSKFTSAVRKVMEEREGDSTSAMGNVIWFEMEKGRANPNFGLDFDEDDKFEDLNEGTEFESTDNFETRLEEETTAAEEAAASLATALSDILTLESPMKIEWDCPYCSSFFPERAALITHIGSEHSSRCWRCPMCDEIMLSSAELKEHFKSEHTPKTAAGQDVPNNNTGAVRDHIQAPLIEPMHASKKVSNDFSCIKCPLESEERFYNLEELADHVKFNHPEAYWPCIRCGILRNTERSLRLHVRVCKLKGKKIL